MKKWKIAAVGIAMAVMLTGCGGATVNGLTLPASLEIAAGESQSMELGYVFSAQELDDAAEQKAIEAAGITWTASGDAVSIGADGMLEAKESGKATVTAKTKDGKEAKCEVTVLPLIEEIGLPESIELEVGGKESEALEIAKKPENGVGEITWQSSDEAVAAVDENGKVTAVGKGECEVTASVNGAEAKTKVTVGVAATGIKLAQDSGVLTVGYSTQLKVYTVPEEAAAASPPSRRSASAASGDIKESISPPCFPSTGKVMRGSAAIAGCGRKRSLKPWSGTPIWRGFLWNRRRMCFWNACPIWRQMKCTVRREPGNIRWRLCLRELTGCWKRAGIWWWSPTRSFPMGSGMIPPRRNTWNIWERSTGGWRSGRTGSQRWSAGSRYR